MSIIEEFRSGKFTIYGQWWAIISALLLIIFGLASFQAVLPFAFAAWIQAAIIVLLEIPIVTQCCPCGPSTSSFLKFFENTVFRTVLYLVFSGIIWLSIIMAASSLIIGAITLTVTFILYGIAATRKEEMQRSFYTGGKGITDKGPAATKTTGLKNVFGLGMAKTARAPAGSI
ncbi:hypothetical protein BC829DRAFT_407783 [Chytridium lagenaria]|nr:hypothetical protein BC829DRAFT_407783 [Chytridium lagenaria]